MSHSAYRQASELDNSFMGSVCMSGNCPWTYRPCPPYIDGASLPMNYNTPTKGRVGSCPKNIKEGYIQITNPIHKNYIYKD